MLGMGQIFCQCDRQSKKVVNSALPLLALIKREGLIDMLIIVTFFQKVKFPNYSNFVEVLQQCSLFRDLNNERMRMTVCSGNA